VLSGELPPVIASMAELIEVLNLSYNSMSGPLPATDKLWKFLGAFGRKHRDMQRGRMH
jgi:hypothetical protein